MSTEDVPGFPLVTLSGSPGKIIRLNVSLFSNTLSSMIKTLNETLVIPAGNTTVYGPGL